VHNAVLSNSVSRSFLKFSKSKAHIFSEVVILKCLSRAVNVDHSEFIFTLFNDAVNNCLERTTE
jgi:hypothetical protein